MVRSECCLLRGLLVQLNHRGQTALIHSGVTEDRRRSVFHLELGSLICLLPLCISASPDLCVSLRTVKDSLNVTLRRRFMKMNFPINYTIQIPSEEVFRLHNISQLREDEMVTQRHLQDLWLFVSQEGIKRVLRVLPERHPTRRKYLSDLENLLRKFEEVYNQPTPGEEDEGDLPDSIQHIWDHLKEQNYQGWKSVTPKSILDNCYRTMRCLFKNCFTKDDDDKTDYCDISWRKEKKTT